MNFHSWKYSSVFFRSFAHFFYLQWSHEFSFMEIPTKKEKGTLDKTAFNGAMNFHSWKWHSPVLSVPLYCDPSMEPWIFIHGNKISVRGRSFGTLPSMEPWIFIHGNLTGERKGKVMSQTFNGAMNFHSWKSAWLTSDGNPSIPPSMEPWIFIHGNWNRYGGTPYQRTPSMEPWIFIHGN